MLQDDSPILVRMADEPAVARRRLRAELKEARRRSGRTQREVAEEMDWSTAKLLRIEAEARISRNDLKVLLGYYGVVDQPYVDALIDLARIVREGESWSDFKDVITDASARRFYGFEASAELIRSYQPILLPGLLQTEEYALAIFRDMLETASERVSERAWEVRRRRQRIHERERPPRMHFLLDEPAVRRPVGGPRVMRRQLVTLRDYAHLPYVTLQVLPYSVGAHPGLATRFVHLEFADPNDDDLVFLETPFDTLDDDTEVTGRYLNRFFKLAEIAATPADTIKLLDGVIAEMEETAAG